MALGIAKCKDMRSRFYVIIIFLLVCRMLMCVQLTVLSVYRVLRVIDVVAFQSRLTCSFMVLFLYPGTLELLLLLMLALDRGVALFAVSYYRNLDWKHAAKMCFAISSVALLVKIGLLFGDPPFSATVTCFVVFDAIPVKLVEFSQNFDLALLLLLLVVYIAILVALRIRLHKLRSKSENDAAVIAINRHMMVMPTVRNIIVVHVAWTLSAKILLSLGIMPFATAYSARFLLFGGFFVASELFVNVVVLLCTNAEIRKATLPCLGGQKIDPLASGSGSGLATKPSPMLSQRSTLVQVSSHPRSDV